MPVMFHFRSKTHSTAEVVPADTQSVDLALQNEACSRLNDPFPNLDVLWISVDQIDDASRRVRRSAKRQRAAIRRSITRFGNRIPILVSRMAGKERYVVIDGHGRLDAARLMGVDHVPCIAVDDLTELDKRRLALSLNRTQETGEWDDEALRLEVSEIIDIDGDLDFPGFEVPEIEALLMGTGEGHDSDPADNPKSVIAHGGEAVSSPGDVWQLGDHAIFCGSARDASTLDELLGEVKVAAVFTDPPYNVRIRGNARSADADFREFAEASGEMPRDAFVEFLTETLGNAAKALQPGGVLFCCMDWRHVCEVSEALTKLGLKLLNICVWVKANPGMGSLYRSQHELVFVARKLGGRHNNNVQLGQYGRNRSNVWTYAGATGGRTDADDDFAVHPTVKPVRMVMDALLDVTGPGDMVFDPFLGSGTTLLAAERTRRRCFGVEIDPAYVDVAIRRWQEIAGGEARCARTGETFAARAAAGNAAGASGSAQTHNSTPNASEDF